MIKIIFLDIDGVIATPESGYNLSQEKQELLEIILKETDAKIVLSSSWRKHNVKDSIDFMLMSGFRFCNSIIGVTIRAYHYLQKGVHLSIPRGVEIKQWIDTNIHSENGKNYNPKELGVDYNYVILDDDTDMLLEHKDNYVSIDGNIGLSLIDVYKAIYILNSTNN